MGKKFTSKEYWDLVPEIEELNETWKVENPGIVYWIQDYLKIYPIAEKIYKEKDFSLKDGTLALQKKTNCPPFVALEAYALQGGFFVKE